MMFYMPLGTEVNFSLAYKSCENCHWLDMWLFAALPQMSFLVLVICNGHIISGSVGVPCALGHFSLSSHVASPSPVGMDPSLLAPLGNLQQGGKVAELKTLVPGPCAWPTGTASLPILPTLTAQQSGLGAGQTS